MAAGGGAQWLETHPSRRLTPATTRSECNRSSELPSGSVGVVAGDREAAFLEPLDDFGVPITVLGEGDLAEGERAIESIERLAEVVLEGGRHVL